jgi:hypothetical protein
MEGIGTLYRTKKLSNGAVAGIRSGHSLNRRPGEPEDSEAATVGRIEDM